MEHPFFPTNTTYAEALRWLTIAEKLLSTRDLMGIKSFVSRARDSDPTQSHADQILSVADTLIAGDRRIGNNQHDWYVILRISSPQVRDSDLIANQYRSLSLLLNTQKNKFPFAEQAFCLAIDAWAVLSNPSRKSMYDKDTAFYLQLQQQQPDPFRNPNPAMYQNFMFFGGSNMSGGVTQPAAPQMRAAVAIHFSQPHVLENPQPQFETHALTVPLLVRMIVKVSERATEYTTGALVSLCSASERAQCDAVAAGALVNDECAYEILGLISSKYF